MRGFMKWLPVCSASLSFFLLGCQPHHPLNATQATRASKARTNYDFVMPEAEQRRLLQCVSEVKIGDSRADVIKALGPPSFDRADVTKDGQFLGRSVVYYLKIW